MDTIFSSIEGVDTTQKASELLFSVVKENSLIEKAYDVALTAHEGQYRKSGEPYIVHPLLVAYLTAYFGGDESMVCAALLHDVVEDTSTTKEELHHQFNESIAILVDGLTKIDEIRSHELHEGTDEKLIQSALTFRKMLTHAIHDPRVLVIKLCDRTHNLLTLDSLSPAKQRKIAEESLVVYAPIAHRLGISKLKNVIEDLSFRYVFPDEYKKITAYLDEHNKAMTLTFNRFITIVKDLLEKNGLDSQDYEIKYRVKHNYSIYLKMQRKGVSIEEVLDLLAVRIIVRDNLECYKVLGLIHQNFKPLIARFKDYIAVPKDNGYQTIHTTIFDENAIVEVQIRTQEMDRVAEYGIAAHWLYKNESFTVGTDWLKNFEFKNESIEEFYELAKNDLFSEDIFVYSPKGDMFTLPRGATALDFAYLVHTHVGNRAVSASVNNQKVPLLHALKSGDIVIIKTGEKDLARCSWINAVRTSRAKMGIRTLCSQKSRELDRRVSKNLIATALSFNYHEFKEWLEETKYKDVIHKVNASISFFEEFMHKVKEESNLRSGSIFTRLRGVKLKKYEVDNLSFYSDKPVNEVLFDVCCHPKKGDEVVAFLNKGKATVHHKFCTHADVLIAEHLPMVHVRWSENGLSRYRLVVVLSQVKGSLLNFLTYLMKRGMNIVSINLGAKSDNFTDYCELVIETKDEMKKLKEELTKQFKVIEFIAAKDAYRGED